MTQISSNRRGAALWITVMVTLVLMMFFISSILDGARSQAGLTRGELGEMQAHYAAIGAINEAFVFLEDNPEWEGSWEYQAMTQNPDLFHSLSASRTESFLGTSEIYLTAQGFTREYGAGTPLAAVGGTAYRPGGGVQHAFFAGEVLQLSSCMVDAYNATLNIGYVPLPTPAPTPIPTSSPSGNPIYSGVSGGASVGANKEVRLEDTTIDQTVVLPKSGLVLNGGRTRGTGATLNSISSNFKNEEKPDHRLDLPSIRVPFDTDSATTVIDSSNWSTLAADSSEPGTRILSPGVYRSVTVPDGQTLAFEPGDYYFAEGFFAVSTSSSRITLKMRTENTLTKLFIGGELTLSGVDFRPVESVDPLVPPAVPAPVISEPAYLRIYGAGVGQGFLQKKICSVSLDDTNFCGLILGEAVEASLRNCEIWGAVSGRNIGASNVNIHYDTSLASIKLAEHSRWRLRGLTRLSLF